jgi:hypothetical protein
MRLEAMWVSFKAQSRCLFGRSGNAQEQIGVRILRAQEAFRTGQLPNTGQKHYRSCRRSQYVARDHIEIIHGNL